MNEFIDDRANERSTEFAASSSGVDLARGDDQRSVVNQRRPVRILLIGERSDVAEMIKNLHVRGFAEAGQWSRPAPWVGTETQVQLLTLPATSVMSVCTKYLS